MFSYFMSGIPLAGASPSAAEPELEPAATELEAVVVTGTRTARTLADVTVRTEVVAREDIAKTGARNLADAVEWTTGVRVENNCQNCNFSQIRLLGLEGPFTQILTDGRPAMTSLASVYGIEQIPSALVERIEIVKGGGSALYGPGSIAGVVNLIPRTPVESGGYLNYTYSTLDGSPDHTVGLGGDWVSADGMAGLTLFGQALDRPAYDRDGDGFTELSRQEVEAGGVRVFKEWENGRRVNLDYLGIREDRRGGDRLDRPVTEANIAESIQSRLHQFGLRWREPLRDDLDFEFNFSATDSRRDSYYGTMMDPNAFGESESRALFADLLARKTLSPEIGLAFGLQYQAEKVEDRQPAYDRLTEQTVENTGMLMQVEWDPTATFNAVAGARLDFNSMLDDPVFSPRIAVKNEVHRDVALRAAISSGFRAPQVFDEDLHIDQAGGVAQIIRNAEGLARESSRSYTLGVEWKPGFFETVTTGGSKQPQSRLRRPVVLETNLFYTRLDDTFDIVENDNPATTEQEFNRVNAGGADVYGVEWNLGWQIHRTFRIDAGYVEQRSTFDDPSGDFGSRNFERTPERYGQITATWNAPWCEVFVGGRFTGPMEVPHFAGFISEDRLETSPTFFTLDVGLRKTWDVGASTVTLSAGVKNLTDEFQADLDRGPLRDAGYVYGPRFPRQFHVGCEVTF